MTQMESYKFEGPYPIDLPTLGIEGVQPGDVVEVPSESGIENHPWFTKQEQLTGRQIAAPNSEEAPQ